MVMTFLRRLRRPRTSEPAELEAFLARQAAYVTQKTVLDYCRVKVGRAEREAFAHPEFQAALHHCRWQTFGAAVQDVSAMVEAWLRPHAPEREPDLAAALVRMAGAVLDAAPAPAEERAQLEAAKEALTNHLAALQLEAPRSADRLPLRARAPLLATLPIPPEERVGETPAITGALRFHFVSSQQEIERRFDAPALALRLLAG